MLLNKFFTITEKSQDDNGLWNYRIKLNADHEIFKGHFPGKPISPGVCNIQMIKECTEDVLGYKLTLGKLKQCKFTQLIIPTENSELTITLDLSGDAPVSIKGQISDGDLKFMELKAEGTKE